MSDPLVLVTGCSGFIGAHVMKVLQEAGYRVKGSVRSLNNKAKIGELHSLCPEAKHPLELVEADLLNSESWKEAVKGCTYVMHTASPVIIQTTVQDPEKELIAPALEGTRAVLNACLHEDSVKRVVLTSSCAAVFASNQPEKEVYTEEDWTDESSKDISPYCRSKTLAEKEAWKIVKENPGKFELSVINPVLVFGPLLTSGAQSSECVKIIKSLVERQYPFLPAIYCQLCDIRDVAEAHLKAMTVPEAAGHRHLIFSEAIYYNEIGKILHKEFNQYGYNPTTKQMPKALAWIGSWFSAMANTIYKKWAITNLYSNNRMQEVLGIQPRPIVNAINDMAYSLIDKGVIQATDEYKNKAQK